MPTLVAESAPTIANLQNAFNYESNAHTRYLDYAAKADSDGWHGIASLLCAAAYAEQVHAANHASVIRQMGGTPHSEIQRPEIRPTVENLRIALGGEQFEIDTTYPAFLEEAIATHNEFATQTFRKALAAEKTHAQLFSEALALVESGDKSSWAGSARPFYVCASCGFTSPDKQPCTICNKAAESFEVIR